jgi:hypothetical protein
MPVAQSRPGLTLAQPTWPRAKLAPGQGQRKVDWPFRARSRAEKKRLDLAQPGLWTV